MAETFPLLVAAGAIVVLGLGAWKTLRAKPEDRVRALVGAAGDLLVFVLIPAAILGSYIYRPQVGAVILGAWDWINALWEWYSGLSFMREVFYLALFAFFVYEAVYLYCYKFFYRFIVRRVFNDLCLVRDNTRKEDYVGRIYKLEAVTTPDGGTKHRVSFVPHNGGWFDWINNRHTLLLDEAPTRLNPTTRVIHGDALESDPTNRRQWRVRTGDLAAFNLGARAGSRIIEEGLEANQSSVGKAIEGNPWALHQRIVRDTGSRAIPRAHTPRMARAPTPNGSVEVNVEEPPYRNGARNHD